MDSGKSKGVVIEGYDKDSVSERLEEIYKRLDFIDAYSAEARAASILAVRLLIGFYSSFPSLLDVGTILGALCPGNMAHRKMLQDLCLFMGSIM